MDVRKNIYDLSDNEWSKFVDAMLRIKAKGIYDNFVREHQSSMGLPTPLFGKNPDLDDRNAAHRGPAFLPWHRVYIRNLEKALQKEIPGVTLPYWDWTMDAELEDSTKAKIWTSAYLGGNGSLDDDWEVKDGPFTASFWPIADDLNGPVLKRHFGEFKRIDGDGMVLTQALSLPTSSEIEDLMTEKVYDHSPWNRYVPGFRNKLEGWKRAAPGQITGSSNHNVVHLWVGGSWTAIEEGERVIRYGSMVPGTSPNDPVFFLHHCFVDKIWADWQDHQEKENPKDKPHYAPLTGGPSGHALQDSMYPWGNNTTPESVLDISAIGYKYLNSSAENVDKVNLSDSKEMNLGKGKSAISLDCVYTD